MIRRGLPFPSPALSYALAAQQWLLDGGAVCGRLDSSVLPWVLHHSQLSLLLWPPSCQPGPCCNFLRGNGAQEHLQEEGRGGANAQGHRPGAVQVRESVGLPAHIDGYGASRSSWPTCGWWLYLCCAAQALQGGKGAGPGVLLDSVQGGAPLRRPDVRCVSTWGWVGCELVAAPPAAAAAARGRACVLGRSGLRRARKQALYTIAPLPVRPAAALKQTDVGSLTSMRERADLVNEIR